MSITECVRDYISACPIFSGQKININYLGNELPSYSLDMSSAEPVIKRYCDGGELRQACFVLAVRDSFDEAEEKNLETAEYLENFSAWIKGQNDTKNLPELSSDLGVSQKIEVTKTACFYDSSYGSARYEIHLRLIYRV